MSDAMLICNLLGVGYLLWRIHRKLAEIEWLITDTRAEVRRRKDDKG